LKSTLLRGPQSIQMANSAPHLNLPQGNYEFVLGPSIADIDQSDQGKSACAHEQSPFMILRRRGGGTSEAQKESRTGTPFPKDFCHLSKANCPSLMGVGSRRKRLLGMKNVDVYALGFYIDEEAAQKALGPKFGSAESSSLEKNQSLCDEVVNSKDIEKTVRIVITSGMLNHDRFLGGLKESLVPACKKAGDVESLPQFEQLFEGAEFKKGMELAFTSTKAGGLAARIDSRDVGEVGSSSFTRAFFGLYLGGSPVSPEGKTNISQGLAKLVVSSPKPAEKEKEEEGG